MIISIFDTETTGLPDNYKAPITDLNNWPRLVQIAWTKADGNGAVISEDCYIVKPDGFIIPKEASDIHGITHERAMAEGVPLTGVMAKFAHIIGTSQKIVAHNINFDKKIMGAEFIRTDIAHELFNRELICTMLASTNHCKLPGKFGGYKWPKLMELYKFLFGEGFEGAHDGRSDASACARCFWELVKREVIKL